MHREKAQYVKLTMFQYNISQTEAGSLWYMK